MDAQDPLAQQGGAERPTGPPSDDGIGARAGHLTLWQRSGTTEPETVGEQLSRELTTQAVDILRSLRHFSWFKTENEARAKGWLTALLSSTEAQHQVYLAAAIDDLRDYDRAQRASAVNVEYPNVEPSREAVDLSAPFNWNTSMTFEAVDALARVVQASEPDGFVRTEGMKKFSRIIALYGEWRLFVFDISMREFRR